MSSKRVLLILAHPDDESFGSGGLVARLVSEGVDVYYICATNGARGTVKAELVEKYGSIEAVRYAELDCAAQTLGFKQVFKLDYHDSGMMGSPENDDPACLWQADEAVVTGQIVEIMRDLAAQIVITFDPYGGYGHPDHIFVHRAATRAFHAASDPAQYTGRPYQPQKLYYTVFPRTLLRYYIWRTRLRGRNPRKMGVNRDLDLVASWERSLKPTAKINVHKWIDVWDAAARCHASQVNPRTRMSRWQRSLLSRQQPLFRAYPPIQNGEKMETDIFAKVEGKN